MRKKIEQFVREWFPFNRQERRGILPLLFLIIFIQASIWLYAAFYTPEFPELVEVSLESGETETGRERFSAEASGWGRSGEERRRGETESFSTIASARVRGEERRRWGERENRGVRKGFVSMGVSAIQLDSMYKKKKLQVLDINEADSAEFVSLPGIGPVMAGRIVDLRRRLGGFCSLDQLTSIYGFKEDLLYDLEGKIKLQPGSHKQIDLNKVTLEELKRHPYFKFTLSRALVNYRQQHGPFHEIEELKKIVLVNDSIFQLIRPYVRTGE